MNEYPAEPNDELLAEELAAIRGELQRVDTKSETLLTLAAGGFALVAAGRPQLGALTGGLLAIGLLVEGAAMLQLLFVVRPRLGTAWSRRLADDLYRSAPMELHTWRRSELAELSLLVLAKYRRLRIAASLLMCALPMMVGAQLATLM